MKGVYDLTNNQILRPVKLPPILTNRECLDSWITCRVCWNGFQSCGVVYINDSLTGTATMQKCPNCQGTREMKSVTTEEKEQLNREIKDHGIEK